MYIFSLISTKLLRAKQALISCYLNVSRDFRSTGMFVNAVKSKDNGNSMFYLKYNNRDTSDLDPGTGMFSYDPSTTL